MRRGAVAGVLLVAVAMLPACRSGTSSATSAASQPTGLAGGGEISPAPTTVKTVAKTRPKATRATSKPAGPVREVAGDCPYITGHDLAQIEGDRFGHSTILTTTPVGCRFYWQYDDNAIITEITVKTYPTATAAYNAMVLTAKGHPEVVSDADIGAGAVAVKAPLQGTLTWQCTFTKGRHVVTAHTRQESPSFNARTLARQVATKF